MLESVILSIISGIFVSAEIVTYEHITKKYPSINGDTLVWIYRILSVFFITIFLCFMMLRKQDYKEEVYATFDNKYVWWYLLLSFLSAISIICFFRSITSAGESSAGIPVTIRSIYIPLAFVLSILLVKKGKWSKYSWPTYIGMGGIIISVGLVIYGSTQDDF